MRNYILGLVIVAATVTSCLKSKETENICETYDPCALKAPQTEITAVETYLADSSITGAVKHCSGMYYKIINEGTGTTPGVCSSITINYRGYYKEGNIFDSTATGRPATFIPVNLITGWTNGIPLIKQGGSIRLFIPPSLAYGPSKPMMIFDIELLDVKP